MRSLAGAAFGVLAAVATMPAAAEPEAIEGNPYWALDIDSRIEMCAGYAVTEGGATLSLARRYNGFTLGIHHPNLDVAGLSDGHLDVDGVVFGPLAMNTREIDGNGVIHVYLGLRTDVVDAVREADWLGIVEADYETSVYGVFDLIGRLDACYAEQFSGDSAA